MRRAAPMGVARQVGLRSVLEDRAEGLAVAQGLPPRDPPVPLLLHGAAEAEQQQLVEGRVGGVEDHAEHLEKLFCKLYPQYGTKVCKVIHNAIPHVDTLIKEFKKPDNDFRIAISIDR